MRQVSRILAVLVVLVLAAAVAPQARPHFGISGYVRCDVIDGPDTPLEGVKVTVKLGDTTVGEVVTDIDGFYSMYLPGQGSYVLTLELPSGSTGVVPAVPFSFSVTYDPFAPWFAQDFLVSNPACNPQKCWMTGGGAKFEPITGLQLAERGTKHSFGGNVYPGCSPDAGDGGSWNHIAHAEKLHFHAQQITVVRCGNVSGIPPGSTSPVTPYNFIEFTGTGTLVGIKGNKVDHGTVYFYARVEDRNEPGSSGAKDGALIDRYFLHVYSNPATPTGSTLFLLDEDGDNTTVDPVLITHGNLQLHISSCSTPPV